MDFTHQTWLITGGASGIGFALAKIVVNHGGTVIICGRSEASLEHASHDVPASNHCIGALASGDA